MRIKKNDLVIILTGKERGMTGRVLEVQPEKDRVVVEGHNIVQRHRKAGPQGEEAGIIPHEAPIHASNVALYSETASGPVRVGSRFLGMNGQAFPTLEQARESFGEAPPEHIRKVRYAPKTGEIFD